MYANYLQWCLPTKLATSSFTLFQYFVKGVYWYQYPSFRGSFQRAMLHASNLWYFNTMDHIKIEPRHHWYGFVWIRWILRYLIQHFLHFWNPNTYTLTICNGFYQKNSPHFMLFPYFVKAVNWYQHPSFRGSFQRAMLHALNLWYFNTMDHSKIELRLWECKWCIYPFCVYTLVISPNSLNIGL